MKIYHFKLALTGLAALLLSACASLPEQLTSQSESVVTDYTIWTQADPTQKGEVRLGGVIASTKNLTDKTRLEIVNLPIDDAGRPSLTSEPQGRFVAYVKGFLDPVTFGEGRLITLVGTTAEPESGKVGDFEHQFPGDECQRVLSVACHGTCGDRRYRTLHVSLSQLLLPPFR